MANLQSQIDILAKAVVNEHVRVSKLQSVSVSDVTSTVPVYNMGGVEIKTISDSDKEYKHQVYELKDKNEIIGTFFGYNNSNEDKKFSGIWCYDETINYVIDQYGDIVTYNNANNKLELTNDSYVRRIGLKIEEYGKNQFEKNKDRMIYIYEETTNGGGNENGDDTEYMSVTINRNNITYNPKTLSYVSGGDSQEYANYTYLYFGDCVVVLNESNNEVIYISDGYEQKSCDDIYNMFMPTSSNEIYTYYKKDGFSVDENVKENLKSVIIGNSVITIGEDSFCDCCNLTNVIMLNSIETIADYAFMCCENLTEISIPKSVKSIGIGAFRGCVNLTEIFIP